MKIQIILLSILLNCHVLAESLAPSLKPLSNEEIGQWLRNINPRNDIDKSIIHRGLISDHTTLRAHCARYLATHGNLSDLPYLIDSLSDESLHVGAEYIYAGMSTTRYWANVALICITKCDLGYKWDDPVEERSKAIQRWKLYWESTKYKTNG